MSENQPLQEIKATILVADDDMTARLLVEEALGQAGLEVVLAEDGETALQLFDEVHPQLVLLDVDMPGIDGFHVCEKIRHRDLARGGQTPVLMVTGMDDLESVTRAYESGATDFLPKPINLPSLGHRVRYMLRAADAVRDVRSLEERTRAMLSAIPDAMLRVDRSGLVLDCHQGRQGEDFFGAACHTGRHLSDVFDAAVAREIAGHMHWVLRSAEPRSMEFTAEGDRSQHDYEARLVRVDSDQALILIRDITERKVAEQKIWNLAYRDQLTRLPNLQSYVEIVDALAAERKDDGSGLAVLLLDLDGFKRVNDTLSHRAGDLLLRLLAERLNGLDAVATAGVQVFKLGGDEFIVLLPTASRPEDAVRLAQAVREECARPFVVNANEVAVTASIGIAMFPHDGDGAIPLLKTAETAMYHAKKLGRNMYQMYRTALTTQLTQRLTIENDLRKALQRDEFEVYYQPQVGLSGADIIGMEALIRWNHPQRGLVSPGEFIPIAEETGLILPIGEWVLRTACRQAAAWREAGFDHLRVAVNLCSLQFGEPDFIAKVAAILDETGLPGTALELELTESLLMDHSDASIAKLSQLRDMDIHLSIDDFGTGYSSMNYLKSFPVGTIKIDRSFIRELPKDRDHAAITTAIIAMAHSLRMKVLAEGVETAEQAEFLSGYGCEGMQGYFYGRPMPAGDATALLREKEATAHRNPALRLARGR